MSPPALGISRPRKLTLRNGLVIEGPPGTIIERNGSIPRYGTSRSTPPQHTFVVKSSEYGPTMEFFADEVAHIEREQLP